MIIYNNASLVSYVGLLLCVIKKLDSSACIFFKKAPVKDWNINALLVQISVCIDFGEKGNNLFFEQFNCRANEKFPVTSA